MTLSARERRLVGLLAAVVAVLGLRWVWSVADPSREVAGQRAARRSGARGASLAALPEGLAVLRTDRLDRAPATPFEVGRDLFRYAQPPAPPPPPAPTAEERERARELAEARRRARETAEQARIPQPPEIPYRYLGSFGPDRRRIAVFSDGGAAILNVLEGETFGDRFVVRRIGLESVDVGFVEFPDEPPRRLAIGE